MKMISAETIEGLSGYVRFPPEYGGRPHLVVDVTLCECPECGNPNTMTMKFENSTLRLAECLAENTYWWYYSAAHSRNV